VLCNKANMDFTHNEKRLAVMSAFIAAWDCELHAKFVDERDLPAAWVNRLFAEGMLQRKHDDIHLYRPTVAGVLWHRAGVAKLRADG